MSWLEQCAEAAGGPLQAVQVSDQNQPGRSLLLAQRKRARFVLSARALQEVGGVFEMMVPMQKAGPRADTLSLG